MSKGRGSSPSPSAPSGADWKGSGEVGQETPREPNLGDLVIVLLASTLAGLRDRLEGDGYQDASEFVAKLTEQADDYLAGGAS